MSTLKIAAYAITKNEDKHVQRWIESLGDFDYVVVLDTGSTDGTVDLLHEHNMDDRFYFGQVRYDPFRFDDARNAALAIVPPDADLCLHVDLDEVVEPGWRDELEKVGLRRRYRYTLRNAATGDWDTVPRSNFHARWGFRWKYPIHEVIAGPQPEHGLTSLQITHLPDPAKPRTDYLPMLQTAVREDPEDPRMVFYLARELSFRGMWEQSRKEFVRFLGLRRAVWPAERCEAYLYLAKMDFEPERWLLRAVSEEPRRREPWVALARHYLKEGDIEQAYGSWLAAEKRNDTTLYTTARDSWGEQFVTLGEELLKR